MTTVSADVIKGRVALATNQVMALPEDHTYQVRPLKDYLKKPWYGLKALPYVTEGDDCDDRCGWLKEYWQKRIIRKKFRIKKPALPTFYCKVDVGGTCPHWVRLVVCKEGIKFIERIESDIIETNGIREVYAVLGV